MTLAFHLCRDLPRSDLLVSLVQVLALRTCWRNKEDRRFAFTLHTGKRSSTQQADPAQIAKAPRFTDHKQQLFPD